VLARETDAARVGPAVALVPDDRFADRLTRWSRWAATGPCSARRGWSWAGRCRCSGSTTAAFGFLVEITPTDLAAALDRLVEGRFTLEPHSGLDADSHARRGQIKLSLLDLPVKPDQLLELIPAELREQLRSAQEKRDAR